MASRVLIGLSDLKEDKREEIMEAYQAAVGDDWKDYEELVWIQMDIDDDGEATYK